MDKLHGHIHTIKLYLLKRNIIRYLHASGILADLEQKIYEFKYRIENLKKKPNFFLYELTFNLSVAGNISENLTNTIVKNPLLFKNAVREVIHLLANLLLEPTKLYLPQVLIAILPTALPNISNFIFRFQKFCSFQGVLIGHTIQKKYVLGTVWECELHNEPFYIEGTPEKCPACLLCTNQLIEKVECKDEGDLVFGIFVNENTLQMNKNSKGYEVTVKITGSCTKDLELGCMYNVTGILASNVFIAWNCVKYVSRPSYLTVTNPVLRLLADFAGSPWMFTYALATQIGKHIYPALSFTHLKLGVLLSLASYNLSSNTMGIPILAMGEDTIEAHSLLNSAFGYTSRCVFPSQGQHVTARFSKDEWQEADPLLLARGGVYYLGDWEKYYKAEKDGCKIRSAIESGSQSEDSNIALRCAVWTYWRKPKTIKDQKHLGALINVFGMPFLSVGKDDCSDCIYFLKDNSNNDTTITDENIFQFLQLVNCHKVNFTERAQRLIKQYFVASRKIRPGCLPIRALTFLTCLSETYARLNLREEVLPDDVVAVIALYEESLQYLFGKCTISPAPLICITDINEVDSQMSNFDSWLKNYIAIIEEESEDNDD